MEFSRGYLLFIVSLYLLAWFIQSSLLFNSDVSWLMLAAKRLVAGGSYTTDFFEVNPPFILYLYIPAVLLTKILPISVIIAVRLYIFFLASSSLCLCFLLNKKIFNEQDKLLFSLFFIALTIVFLILPLNEFGQREQLLMILTMPYFLLLTCRLKGIVSYSNHLLIIIGILAGAGFAIKPYFLMAYLLVEFYYCLRTKNLLSRLRLETLAIFSVLIMYALVIFLRHEDYLTVVLPFVSTEYYQKYHSLLKNIILGDQAVFSYFVILFYALCYKKNPYRELCTVILFATIGFLAVYFFQRNFWFYHYIPAFSMSCLLLTLLFGMLATKKIISHKEYRIVGTLTVLMFIYYFYQINYIGLSILLFPAIYFSLFVCLFSFLFYIAYEQKNIFKILFSLSIIFFIGLILYETLPHTLWKKHLFLLTTLMLILLFIVLIPQKSNSGKLHFSFLAIAGIILFAYPFFEIGYINNYSAAYIKLFHDYLNNMRQYTNKSVYIFSDSSEFSFPAVDYLQQKFPSRFGCFGWIPEIKNQKDPNAYQVTYQKNRKLMDFFIGAIANDIERNHPDFIFVDSRRKNLATSLGYFGNNQVEYLKLFLLDPRFKKEWQSYHYLKTMDGQPLYRFQIYARNL